MLVSISGCFIPPPGMTWPIPSFILQTYISFTVGSNNVAN